MLHKWTKKLSGQPLCKPPEPPCADDYMVNAAAISNDGSRVVGEPTTKITKWSRTLHPCEHASTADSAFYVFNTRGSGTRLLSNEFAGDEGIYTVAISGDGAIAGGAGLLNRTNATQPRRGIARVFEVATSTLLLDTTMFVDRVNSMALSRTGEVLALVAESSLYVFIRQPAGSFGTTPQLVELSSRCDTVAVHPRGTWIAAADFKGTVYFIPIAGGVVGTPATWVAREPDATGGPSKRVKFRSAAISRIADAFVVGGGRFVYYLTRASTTANTRGPVARFANFGDVEKTRSNGSPSPTTDPS